MRYKETIQLHLSMKFTHLNYVRSTNGIQSTKKKFTMSLQKTLKDDLKAVLVFGGVAATECIQSIGY